MTTIKSLEETSQSQKTLVLRTRLKKQCLLSQKDIMHRMVARIMLIFTCKNTKDLSCQIIRWLINGVMFTGFMQTVLIAQTIHQIIRMEPIQPTTHTMVNIMIIKITMISLKVLLKEFGAPCSERMWRMVEITTICRLLPKMVVISTLTVLPILETRTHLRLV